MNYDSLDIMHYVILASILEPIPEKIGCTTRKNDWQEKSKLEYFLISGVNIGKVFYELSERIKRNNDKQPFHSKIKLELFKEEGLHMK